MALRVLFVCTGNICRSPMAERLFRARLDPKLPVVAASAGVAGLEGHAMDHSSAVALRELGGDPSGHVGRRLTPTLLGDADLILTADAGHRSIVVQTDPLAFRRTFTMREFGRLGRGLPALPEPVDEAALRARVAEVAGRRGWVDPAEPGGDDIGDPYGASLDAVRQAADQVAAAVAGIVGALGLSLAAQPDRARIAP